MKNILLLLTVLLLSSFSSITPKIDNLSTNTIFVKTKRNIKYKVLIIDNELNVIYSNNINKHRHINITNVPKGLYRIVIINDGIVNIKSFNIIDSEGKKITF